MSTFNVEKMKAASVDQSRIEDRNPEESKFYTLETCRGKTLGCPFALTDLTPLKEVIFRVLDASDFPEQYRKIDGPIRPHHRFKIALSACPNGCSQPQIKDFGVLARIVPRRTERECTLCGACKKVCLEGAISYVEEGPLIEEQLCVACGQCTLHCPTGALGHDDPGYTVLIGGKLGRHPQFGLELTYAADQDTALRALTLCLRLVSNSQDGERRFGDTVNRIGIARIREELQAESEGRSFT